MSFPSELFIQHSAILSATAQTSSEVGKTLTETLSNRRKSNGHSWLTTLFAVLAPHAVMGLLDMAFPQQLCRTTEGQPAASSFHLCLLLQRRQGQKTEVQKSLNTKTADKESAGEILQNPPTAKTALPADRSSFQITVLRDTHIGSCQTQIIFIPVLFFLFPVLFSTPKKPGFN